MVAKGVAKGLDSVCSSSLVAQKPIWTSGSRTHPISPSFLPYLLSSLSISPRLIRACWDPL
uniref:Uncharacterized protein n=1 Tax=Picea glauca TaxID=3330 RepID=A0A124GN77_PICGL|nr:hypothetical protein ABT39_MTgene4972 [Picea glauca]QHR86602.1 hypothetical protein Q903MT_gene605 [Picea sitchensis]